MIPGAGSGSRAATCARSGLPGSGDRSAARPARSGALGLAARRGFDGAPEMRRLESDGHRARSAVQAHVLGAIDVLVALAEVVADRAHPAVLGRSCGHRPARDARRQPRAVWRGIPRCCRGSSTVVFAHAPASRECAAFSRSGIFCVARGPVSSARAAAFSRGGGAHVLTLRAHAVFSRWSRAGGVADRSRGAHAHRSLNAFARGGAFAQLAGTGAGPDVAPAIVVPIAGDAGAVAPEIVDAAHVRCRFDAGDVVAVRDYSWGRGGIASRTHPPARRRQQGLRGCLACRQTDVRRCDKHRNDTHY